MARKEHLHSFKKSLFIHDILKSKIFCNCLTIQSAGKIFICQERFYFRSKHKPFCIFIIIQWFNADSVTSKEKKIFFCIPDGKGKHSIKLLHTLRAILFIGT